jgi:hypothetical protein
VIGAILLSCLVGALITFVPDLALVVALAAAGMVALSAHPAYWALAAVVAAVVARVPVAFGVAPAYVVYLDLPLSLVSLALALHSARVWPQTARRLMYGLLGLGACIIISGALAGSSPARSVLSFALLGVPFVVIAAIVLAPPPPSVRARLVRAVLFLAFIQLAAAVVQLPTASDVDDIRGTFLGSDAGAHLAAGVAAVGAIWLLAHSSRPTHFVAPVALLAVPFLASAKQVIFALPATLIASPMGSRFSTPTRAAVIIGAVLLLVVTPSLNQTYSLNSINQATSGEGAKPEVARELAGHLREGGGATLAFGLGPANSVSHSALLTTDPLRGTESALTGIGLEPSETTLDLAGDWTGGASFSSPYSSAAGLVGDLGVVGTAVYMGLFLVVFLAAWRMGGPDGSFAVAALGLFALLGLIFTWWEQTGFSLYVAFLVGIALADAAGRNQPSGADLTRARTR